MGTARRGKRQPSTPTLNALVESEDPDDDDDIRSESSGSLGVSRSISRSHEVISTPATEEGRRGSEEGSLAGSKSFSLSQQSLRTRDPARLTSLLSSSSSEDDRVVPSSLTDPNLLKQEIDRFEAEVNAMRRGPTASPKQRRRSSLALAFTNIRQKLKKGPEEGSSPSSSPSGDLDPSQSALAGLADGFDDTPPSPTNPTSDSKRKQTLSGHNPPPLRKNRSNSVFLPTGLSSTLSIAGPGGYKEGVLYINFLPFSPLLLAKSGSHSGSSSLLLKPSSSSSSSLLTLPPSGASGLPPPTLLSREDALAAAKKFWVVLDEFFLYAYEDRLDTESPAHEIKLPGTHVRRDRAAGTGADYFWLEKKGHPLAYIFPDGLEGLEEHRDWAKQLTDVCQFYHRGGSIPTPLEVRQPSTSSNSSFKSSRSTVLSSEAAALNKDLRRLEETLQGQVPPEDPETVPQVVTTQSPPVVADSTTATATTAVSQSSPPRPTVVTSAAPAAFSPDVTFPEEEPPVIVKSPSAKQDLRQAFVEAQKNKQTLLVRQDSQTRGFSKSNSTTTHLSFSFLFRLTRSFLQRGSRRDSGKENSLPKRERNVQGGRRALAGLP